MQNAISVFSTYSTDRIIKNGKTTVSDGGPMYFIKRAFSDCNVPFIEHIGETITVEIKVENGSETGRVLNPNIKSSEINPDNSKFILISTIFNEWVLPESSGPNAKIFVDIQGFVRNPKMLGGKMTWQVSPEITQKIYCMKGTKEEISYLPKEILDDQKTRLLIITNGNKNIDWFLGGKKYSLEITKKINPPNTIGAGDTFFAYFVASKFLGKNTKDSINFAINKTAEFLESK